jgi:amino acid transporter
MAPLRRSLGPFALAFYGLGLILGAGIYSIVGKAAGVAGEGVWLSFLFGSLAALFTGLSYAELSAMHPKAGAEYAFARASFPRVPWLAPLIGLLLVASGIGTCATVATAFAGYAAPFLAIEGIVLSIALLFAAAALNVVGVREASWANVVFTIVEAAGLVIVIVVGWRDPDFGAALSAPIQGGVLAGASLIFFAYLGFENIANFAEEAKRPERDIPRAILISIGASTILYVLVALACVALAAPEDLARSDAPLAEAMRRGAPRWTGVLSGVALFATANTVLIAMLAAARMLFGLARGWEAPPIFARLLPGRKTPVFATAAVFSGALVLLPLGRVELLGSVASLTALVAFLVVNACAVRLRFTQPGAKRPFRTPLAVGRVPVLPVLGALLTLVLLTRFEGAAYVILSGVTLGSLGLIALGRRMRGRRAPEL